MALSQRRSSAPLFTTLDERLAALTEDSGSDLILGKRGANQFLGDDANHHDGQIPFTGGIVGLDLITNSAAPLGRPTKGNPLGAQKA